MKKFLFTLAWAGVCALAFSQTPTWDFESWTTMNGPVPVPEEPTGWLTGNQLVTFFTPGNDTSVFKASGTEAHSGQYAMKVTTVDVVNNPDPSVIPDPIGYAVTGDIVGTIFVFGFSYSARPDSVAFWYMNTLSGADTASFFCWLTKWNGTGRDTIATAYWETYSSAASYVFVSDTLSYDVAFPTTIPDTAGFFFSATGNECLTCGNVGSILWVDDITFSGWNGVNEHPSSNGVILFPNPASNFVTISVDTDEASSVIVHDITGREVASASLAEPMNSIGKKAVTLNLSNLCSGLFSYSVIDDRGNILRAGKFNVVK